MGYPRWSSERSGAPTWQEYIDHCIEQADVNKDGKIDIDEFLGQTTNMPETELEVKSSHSFLAYHQYYQKEDYADLEGPQIYFDSS